MENLSVVPMLFKHRIDKSGKAQLVLRVYKNRQVICNEKLFKIEPIAWDDQKREVKRSAMNHHLLNAKIKKRTGELEQQFLQSELLGINLSKGRIKNIINGQNTYQDYFKFCREVIPVKYAKETQLQTRRQHLSELTKLALFKSEVSFTDIDFKFLSEYRAWMINVRQNNDNTIWKSFKGMYAMTNEALRRNVIKENPFKDFDRGKYKQGHRSYLEIADCDKILEQLTKDLPGRLKEVGYYFLFMCYTGLRFRDALVFFNYDTHIVNNDRLVITTEKVKTEINILIHSRLRIVLNFIQHNKPEISNPDFNRYLKVVQTMAGIEVPLSAHVARHTFGATLAELDVPIEKAQKLLGHKDKKSTEIYYHIKNKSLDIEMMKWDKL